LFGKTPLKAQNDYVFQKFWGYCPFAPPWLRLWPHSIHFSREAKERDASVAGEDIQINIF